MNPNDVVGTKYWEDNIMWSMQYVDYEDVGSKCISLLLENGGDVNTVIENVSVIGDIITKVFFDLSECQESYRIPHMITYIAYDEETNTDTDFIKMKNGYTPEFLKVQNNYRWDVEFISRADQGPYDKAIIHIFDRTNGIEVAEIL